MLRRVVAVLAISLGLAAFFLSRQPPRPAGSALTPVYHPSSASLVATTGRPQLLEFFHKA
jgi:hypothetical protein